MQILIFGLINMVKQSILLGIVVCIFILGCQKQQQADLIIRHAHILAPSCDTFMHTVCVIHDGKILETGDSSLLQKYKATEVLDAEGMYLYPGWNDAHAHFYGYGQNLQTVDLTGTHSWDEVLQKCVDFYQRYHPLVLRGRGWDQHDWKEDEFPVNKKLDALFPGVPVFLKRVDGHAAIASSILLQQAGITADTKIDGGEVLVSNHKPTGVLIDNAVDLVQDKLPQWTNEEQIKALIDAQKVCFEYGVTSLTEPGLDKEVIELIDSLQQAGKLFIRINAMISASDKNIAHYTHIPPLVNEKLRVGSFKIYADGALGSHGACLLKPYSDLPNHKGFLLSSPQKLEEVISKIAATQYQACTHCIGDSSNRLLLTLYAKYLKGDNDRRWRIEHAQIMDSSDFALFKKYSIVPSVQPTHATSDMYWAEKNLGQTRIKYAYAYHTLLLQNGWIPLGTDFPVEHVSPYYTFYAAVARQDDKGIPPSGFQRQEALSRVQAIQGITIWPAKAAFEEDKKGTIEKGKYADIVFSKKNLLKDELIEIRNSKPEMTMVNGKIVYQQARP
jgi:predicted amidohydrolase YtcJ